MATQPQQHHTRNLQGRRRQVFFERAKHSNIGHLGEVGGLGWQVEQVNIVRNASSGVCHMT